MLSRLPMTHFGKTSKKISEFLPGIHLDHDTGHLFYGPDYKPVEMKFDCIFIRHGETFGNCGQATADVKIDTEAVAKNIKNTEQRIFQGQVDTTINQLNDKGKQQANEAADKLEKLCKEGEEWIWKPDLILHSPLSRARDTGKPFVERHGFQTIFKSHQNLTELSFGAWENRRVCDMKKDDPCHTFYQKQNALIKSSGINGNGIHQAAENFAEVLLRAHHLIKELNTKFPAKKIIMFSHSMLGAAFCILMGKGQRCENQNYLAFDGKKSNGEPYTMPHATPFILKMNVEKVLTLKPAVKTNAQ